MGKNQLEGVTWKEHSERRKTTNILADISKLVLPLWINFGV